MTYGIRVRRLSNIPASRPAFLEAATLEWVGNLSETGMLRVQLSEHAEVNGPIAEGEELAVEIVADSTRTEPEAGRFTVVGRSLDETDQAAVVTLECAEYVALRLAAAKLATEGPERVFSKMTPGAILHSVLTEATTRGAAEGVTWTFTATHDSAGTPWPRTLTIDLPGGQPATETLRVLAEAGYLHWSTRGRELLAYARETVGTDHPFTVGINAHSWSVRSSILDYATAVTGRDAEGRVETRTGSTHGINLGRFERDVSVSGMTDPEDVAAVLDAQLADGAPKTELQLEIYGEKLERYPGIHFHLGDRVHVRRKGKAEQVRVSAVQVRMDAQQVVTVALTVMDRLADNSAKLARKVRAIQPLAGSQRLTTGRSGGSGGGGRVGVIDPAYREHSGNPAGVDFGSGELEGPFSFIHSYSPAASDRVFVVGDRIIGRVVAEPGDTDGSQTEPLPPAVAWQDLDTDRYGTLRITKTSSDWVFLSGMLEMLPDYLYGDPEVSKLITYIPAGMRPQRQGPVVLNANSETIQMSGNLTPGAGLRLTLDPATGALSVYKRPGYYLSVPSTISLAGVAWNVGTGDLWNFEQGSTGGGIDSEGTAYMIASGVHTAQHLLTIPADIRPALLPMAFLQWMDWGQPALGTILDDGTIISRLWWDEHGAWDSAFWQRPGTSAYEWETLNPINGYDSQPGYPFQVTKTPSGIVRLRGMPAEGGVPGQTALILPSAYRPAKELLLPSGLRVTPSGAVSGLTNGSAFFEPDGYAYGGYNGNAGLLDSHFLLK